MPRDFCLSNVKFRQIVEPYAAEIFSVASAAVDGDMTVCDIDPSVAGGINGESRRMPCDEVFIGEIPLSVIGSFVKALDRMIFVERLFGRKIGESAVDEDKRVFPDGDLLVK